MLPTVQPLFIGADLTYAPSWSNCAGGHLVHCICNIWYMHALVATRGDLTTSGVLHGLVQSLRGMLSSMIMHNNCPAGRSMVKKQYMHPWTCILAMFFDP